MEAIIEEKIEKEVVVEEAPAMNVLARLHRLEKLAEAHGIELAMHDAELDALNDVVGI